MREKLVPYNQRARGAVAKFLTTAVITELTVSLSLTKHRLVLAGSVECFPILLVARSEVYRKAQISILRSDP
jgi:hypothetical protein